MGDKENAIQSWEVVLRNVPDDQKPQIPTYQKALQQLREQK